MSALGFTKGIARKEMGKRQSHKYLAIPSSVMKNEEWIQNVVTDVDFNTVSIQVCIAWVAPSITWLKSDLINNTQTISFHL